jgi:hypothetical protein
MVDEAKSAAVLTHPDAEGSSPLERFSTFRKDSEQNDAFFSTGALFAISQLRRFQSQPQTTLQQNGGRSPIGRALESAA